MTDPQGEPTPDPYQRVPYPGVADPETPVRVLEALAVLHGLSPAPVAACRVLEIGCASGRNLLPQAADFPTSEFRGVDAAAEQIDRAQAVADEAGLANVRLQRGDIAQIDATWGQFDYLLCPGVFSWVPERLQGELLRICRENLAPHGVAIITHNVYPGWHFRGLVRDLMRYHVAAIEPPREQIAAARAILGFAAEHCPATTAHGQVFRSERDDLRRARDEYLYHEYLIDENRPLYFHEFLGRAEQRGLQLLCDANLAKMNGSFMPAEVQQVLANTPLVQRCQLLDFLRNESFHKTLLCHRETLVDRTWRADVLEKLHLILVDVPQPAQFDASSPEPVELTFPVGKLTTRDPLGKAAIGQLILARPQPISLSALHQAAVESLHEQASDDDRGEAGRVKLVEAMAGAMRAGLVKIYHDPPRFCSRVSPRPLASPLVRAWARQGATVVNQLHENIPLTATEASVLARLDGTRSPDDLAANPEQPTIQPGARRAQVDETLQNLAARALLIG